MNSPEEMAEQVRLLAEQLKMAGRKDLLLRAIGAPLLEELRIEAARTKLSRLQITKDYRFFLVDYDEGIEFKRLGEYRDELTRYYMATAKLLDKEKIMEGVDHLVNPLDNAINEKCSRIKKVFLDMMDEYAANYYIISGHTQKRFAGSSRIWYERLKVITLPRELVVNEQQGQVSVSPNVRWKRADG